MEYTYPISRTLQISLLYILLVDAKGINPERSRTFLSAELQ
jgi:hypothetical protein